LKLIFAFLSCLRTEVQKYLALEGGGSSTAAFDLVGEAHDFYAHALFLLRREVVVEEMAVGLIEAGSAGGWSFFEGGEEGAEQLRNGHVAVGCGKAGVLEEFVGEFEGDVCHGMLLEAEIRVQEKKRPESV
jgi:hypothetical protein